MGVNASTLRFWESEFRQLKPVKSSTNQRYYTQRHIEFLKRLKNMLYVEKYTIEGAKKKLCSREAALENEAPASEKAIGTQALKKELLEVLELLK